MLLLQNQFSSTALCNITLYRHEKLHFFKRMHFENRRLSKIKRVFLQKIQVPYKSFVKKTHICLNCHGKFLFYFFFCKRKFLPLCKAISNSEKILLENTLNACALIYDGELSFWVCKVSRNQISQYVHELLLELHI